MIIAVGKKYRMRNGDITEMIKQFGTDNDLFESDIGWWYGNFNDELDDGSMIFGIDEPHQNDLMEEIK